MNTTEIVCLPAKKTSLMTFLMIVLVIVICSSEALAASRGAGPSKAAISRGTKIHEFKGGLSKNIAFEWQKELEKDELRRNAPVNHEALQVKTLENALAWIDRLSAPNFVAHLSGLSSTELKSVGVDHLSLHTIDASEYYERANVRLTVNEIAIYRQKYRSYVEALIVANRRELVRKLSAGEVQHLLEFALRNGVNETEPAKLNPTVVDRWVKSVSAEQEAFSRAFPLRKAPGRADDPRRSLAEITDIVLRGSEAHEHQYARAAFNAYVAKNPRLSRLELERWRFRANDISQLWDVLKHLEAPLPGGEPEIVFFLDRAVAAAPIAKMSKAWTGNLHAEPRLLTHEDIGLFLREFVGRTLVLVGHIEHRQFVQQRGAGQPPLKVDIPTLLETAQEKGVFLVPIGCNSAEAGAYFGFTRPISSDEVAGLLKAIPSGQLSVGDFLSAFNAIGNISVDAPNFERYLEVTVHKPKIDGSHVQHHPIVVTRVPLTQPGASVPTPFSAYLNEWESQHRPFLDSGLLASWRAWYRGWPTLTLLLTGFTVVLAALGWGELRDKVFRRRALISKREDNLISAVIIIGVMFLAAAVLRFIVAWWVHLLCILAILIFASLGEMVFGEKESKEVA